MEPVSLFGEDGSFQLGHTGQFVFLGGLVDRRDSISLAKDKAAMVAVREANENGAVDGKRFAYISCNYNDAEGELGKNELITKVTHWMTREAGIPALLGPHSSEDTLTTFEAANPAHDSTDTLVMSSSATSPLLTVLDTRSLLWRTCPLDVAQGEVIAEDMYARGVQQVFVIPHQSAYGEGLAQSFQGAFEALGGEVIGTSIFSSTNEVVAQVAAVHQMDGDFELLFISKDVDDIVAFLREVRKKVDDGFWTRRIFVPDAGMNTAAVAVAGAPAMRALLRGSVPGPSREGTSYAFFESSFRNTFPGEEFPDSVAFVAHAYDAAWMLIYGSAWGWYQEGELTGPSISAGLRNLNVEGASHVDVYASAWPVIRSNFSQGISVDIEGVSGDLTYDASEEIANPVIDVWRVAPNCGGSSLYTVETLGVGEDPPPTTCD